MLNNALETGVFFHRGPVLGNMEGMILSQALDREGSDFSIKKTFLGESERH